jgi:putative PIN family toxin of toxin-antitoxin system
MTKVVFDASSLVGALLKADSVPEHALLLARAHASICLSDPVEHEIRAVFSRPKFRRYLTAERIHRILDLLTAAAIHFHPSVAVAECRDAKDNKYLELALAAQAETIIASDSDLLVLMPWRGIEIITPAAYVARFPATPGGE